MRIALFYCLSAHLLCFSQKVKLEKNQAAPSIIAEDIYGKKLDLTSLQGSKKVLISFHRYASCPICNFKIRELVKHYDNLSKSGVEIIVFIESSKDKILAAYKNLEIPFYVIADPENKYYKLYGVRKNTLKIVSGVLNKNTRKMLRENWHTEGERGGEGYTNRMGADFIIDLNGNIEDVQYARFLGDGMNIERVKNCVVRQ